ncbi:hypothetical protein L6Q21_13075 [Sandaracinobacter sp. RS1-74]|uniref:hypothetical protein n=1 Tax=Sandaracinobacteroides sayramensis TaxID=2913411 RepID=UPI001EDBC74B|nr:hypothetical protein [Sandaracinobacteroides sayramensis]MCG2841915.1 hypothetical protein [Sandaracinobacteroides sayramensis]
MIEKFNHQANFLAIDDSQLPSVKKSKSLILQELPHGNSSQIGPSCDVATDRKTDVSEYASAPPVPFLAQKCSVTIALF